MKKFALLASLAALALSTPNAEAGLFNNDCCYSDSCCDGKFIVGAEWLYWKVEADNLNAAFAGSINEQSQTFKTNKIAPSFKWDSGFRVFAGYEFCDCWELDIQYTYLPTTAKTGYFISDGKTNDVLAFNPLQFPILLGGAIGSLTSGGISGLGLSEFRGNWDFNANCIDVDLTKTICFGECLRLRPHAGFRAFWFDQKYKLFAKNSDEGTGPIPGGPGLDIELNIDTHFKQNFRGYGVEGGLWGEYDIGCGLSVVGHFGGAILYSKSTVKQNLLIFPSEYIDENFELNNSYTDKIGIPMLDTFLGLQYADCVCDMMVFGKIGWESHVAFDANRLPTNHGNITAQGLTLGLGVGF